MAFNDFVSKEKEKLESFFSSLLVTTRRRFSSSFFRPVKLTFLIRKRYLGPTTCTVMIPVPWNSARKPSSYASPSRTFFKKTPHPPNIKSSESSARICTILIRCFALCKSCIPPKIIHHPNYVRGRQNLQTPSHTTNTLTLNNPTTLQRPKRQGGRQRSRSEDKSIHWLYLVKESELLSLGERQNDARIWSSSRVKEWLDQNGMKDYDYLVEENKIEGQHLPLLANTTTLMKLGINRLGDRKKLKRLVEQQLALFKPAQRMQPT